VDQLKTAGKPEEYAHQWATTYLAVSRGEFGMVAPSLGRLLGRPLRTMERRWRDRADAPTGGPPAATSPSR
jgi:hypothetical protein